MVVYTKEFLEENSEKFGWDIGEHSYGKPSVQQWGNDGKLKIGKYCSIAGNVKILLGGNHRTDWVTTYPFNVLVPEYRDIGGHPSTRGDVIIGNDVWIGQDCHIISGVKIGNGACIATGSLVAKDVPDYAIVGGNPAKVIKMRFSDEEIESLLNISWWDWHEEKVRAEIPSMLSADISAFIDRHLAI